MHEYFEETSEEMIHGDCRGKWKLVVSVKSDHQIASELPEDKRFVAYGRNKKEAKKMCYGLVLEALEGKARDEDEVLAMKERRKLQAMLGDKLLGHVLGEVIIDDMGGTLTPEALQDYHDALLSNDTLSLKLPSVFPDVISDLGNQYSEANVNANATIFEAETWKVRMTTAALHSIDLRVFQIVSLTNATRNSIYLSMRLCLLIEDVRGKRT